MDTKLMNTPVTNFEALVGQARDCGLTQTFATAYEVNKALDEADCCGGGSKAVLGNDIKLGYSTFTEIPENIDFSQTTNFGDMFIDCRSLKTVLSLDTSNGTDFGRMFQYCVNLKSVSPFDTSNGIGFGNMFFECTSLPSIPLLDTSNGTNLGNMFYNCTSLTSVPPLNTSKNINFYNMFQNCWNLTSIPQLDTSNGTSFSNTFYNCTKLTTIPQLNVSKSTTFSGMFTNCTNLQNIQFTGSINKNIDFSPCKVLSYDSVKSILTACSNTTNTNAKTLKFNRTLTDQNGELTALVADCTSKGWTISGLTLN